MTQYTDQSIIIETPRLQMRQFTLNDVDAVYYFNSHNDVTRFTGDQGIIQSRKDAEAVIRNVWLPEYERYGYARYALIHKRHNKVIGFAGLKYEPELKAADIGYRMLPEYWGKGLGYEVAEASLQHGLNVLGLPHIVAEVVKQNIGSIRIIEKLGFRRTESYIKGEFEVLRFDYYR